MDDNIYKIKITSPQKFKQSWVCRKEGQDKNSWGYCLGTEKRAWRFAKEELNSEAFKSYIQGKEYEIIQ